MMVPKRESKILVTVFGLLFYHAIRQLLVITASAISSGNNHHIRYRMGTTTYKSSDGGTVRRRIISINKQRRIQEEEEHEQEDLSFAMVSGNSVFFLPVETGWQNSCNEFGISSCEYMSYVWLDYDRQDLHPCAHEVLEFLRMQANGTIELHGIAAQCRLNDNPTIFQQAHDQGIPIVVFDSIPPKRKPETPPPSLPSSPSTQNNNAAEQVAAEEEFYTGPEPNAYINSDNVAMGRLMARLTKQLVPSGGTFGILYFPDSTTQNQRVQGYLEEIFKDNYRQDRPHWYQIDGFNRTEKNVFGGEYLAMYKPTVIVFMFQSVMRHKLYREFVQNNTDIVFISTDGVQYQLDYLNSRYVHGLIGQMPYDFGKVSAEVLYDLVQSSKQQQNDEYYQNEQQDDYQSSFSYDKTKYNNLYNATLYQPLEIATNLVSYNLVPLELPPLDVDQNLLGNLVYVGCVCFAILSFSAIGCICWTIYHWKKPVIEASQYYFLISIPVGIMIMSSAIIPLSMDDNGNDSTYLTVDTTTGTDGYDYNDDESLPGLSTSQRIGMCMSIPWLACCGFSVTFSALFSKTLKVHQVITQVLLSETEGHRSYGEDSKDAANNGSGYDSHGATAAGGRGAAGYNKNEKNARGGVLVQPRGFLIPFAILFSSNVLVLTLWTVLDPLMYTRQFGVGTDYWNRELTSYGSCVAQKHKNAAPYIVTLILINFIPVLIGCKHVFEARSIHHILNEATYISLSIFSFAQAFLTGLPIVAISRKIPQGYYLVMTFLLFILGMVILSLTFVPKYFMERAARTLSEADQKKLLTLSSSVAMIRRVILQQLQVEDEHNVTAALSLENTTKTSSLPLSHGVDMQQQHQQDLGGGRSSVLGEYSSMLKYSCISEEVPYPAPPSPPPTATTMTRPVASDEPEWQQRQQQGRYRRKKERKPHQDELDMLSRSFRKVVKLLPKSSVASSSSSLSHPWGNNNSSTATSGYESSNVQEDSVIDSTEAVPSTGSGSGAEREGY